MEVTIEQTPQPVTVEPSTAELRSMWQADSAVAEPTTEAPKPETAEPVEAKPETDLGTVETKQQPEEIEEELDEGVKKRIAKEVARQARADRAVVEAISNRKAAEAKLAEVTGKPGSEPAPTTAPVTDGRPARPDPSTFPTWGEYLEAVAKYEPAYESWLQSETRKTVEKEFTAKQAAEEGKRAWTAAVEQQPELPAMAKEVMGNSPEDFQLAVSALDDWAGVTVHLGKNPAELSALVEKFKASPMAAIAQLGKLEARLQPAAKQAEKTVEKPLPAPLKAVAGSASATAPVVDLEKADYKTFKKTITQALKAG